MTTEKHEAFTKLAEQMIAESRLPGVHTCDEMDSECFGCDSMRAGLELLAFLGDPSVYRA